jgi:hypothetical protein
MAMRRGTSSDALLAVLLGTCAVAVSALGVGSRGRLAAREGTLQAQLDPNVSNLQLLQESAFLTSATAARVRLGVTHVYPGLRLIGLEHRALLREDSGFVKVSSRKAQASTMVFDVEIATPAAIECVFAVLYIPILLGWACYFCMGSTHQNRESTYAALLILSLCATLIGDNFVNKSLAVLLPKPMAITSAQSMFMALVAFVWCVGQFALWMVGDSTKKCPDLPDVSFKLFKWGAVALMFTLYQLMNHLVHTNCSLSERTVFICLCPVVSLFFELLVMPVNLQARATTRSKLSLVLMVFGAVLFSSAYPDFSNEGILVATVMVGLVVPYRLAQRYALNVCEGLPVMLLTFYDAVFLVAPSTLISVREHSSLILHWDSLVDDPAIPLMLFLSLLTFTSNHVFALLLLQAPSGSATSLQVFQNLSSFAVVGLGIACFGDRVSSPVVTTGMSVCLLGGLWYSLEMGSLEAAPKAISPKEDLSEPVKFPAAARLLFKTLR